MLKSKQNLEIKVAIKLVMAVHICIVVLELCLFTSVVAANSQKSQVDSRL